VWKSPTVVLVREEDVVVYMVVVVPALVIRFPNEEFVSIKVGAQQKQTKLLCINLGETKNSRNTRNCTETLSLSLGNIFVE
jgi:hypothetical protein